MTQSTTSGNSHKNRHIPVLITQILEYLNLKTVLMSDQKEAINIFDGTFGGGGYFEQIKNAYLDGIVGDQKMPKGGKSAEVEADKYLGLEYFGYDLDPLSVEYGEQNFGEYTKPEALDGRGGGSEDVEKTRAEKSNKIRLNLDQANFAEAITSFEDCSLDYIILDLGFCTNQFDYNRGFSYGPGKKQAGTSEMDTKNLNAPSLEDESKDGLEVDFESDFEEVLDLRFDPRIGMSASQKIRLISPRDLARVIYNYSGEELSRKIADKIFERLLEKDKTIAKDKNLPQKDIKKSEEYSPSSKPKQQKTEEKQITVSEFRAWVEESIPARYKKNTNKILSRVWQALRIWVNGEMENLALFLEAAPQKLKNGGRLIIVDFHSLEDKLITKHFRDLSKPYTDDFGNQSWNYKLLTRRPIAPSEQEIQENPASRSASLRVLERV